MRPKGDDDLPGQPEAQRWPAPTSAPPRPPDDFVRKQALLMMHAAVRHVEVDGSTNLATCELRTPDDLSYVRVVTRPPLPLGQYMSVWRLPNGEVYAIGPKGDRHQVSVYGSQATPLGAHPPPFAECPEKLVVSAIERANELGLRLEVERTGVVVKTARGTITQPFIETWENTLALVGLSEQEF